MTMPNVENLRSEPLTEHRFRVAVIGIGCENCTFSTMPTTLEHFRPILDAKALEDKYMPLTSAKAGSRTNLHTGEGLERGFDDADFKFICYCRAIPGGPIEAKAIEQLRTFISEGLKRLVAEGPLDGVYLDLHGAMFATGTLDLEGGLCTLVRDIVKNAVIAASFDLHGNFSRVMAGMLDAVVAYRTAPHIDITETRLKTIDILMRGLRCGKRPKIAYVPIPLAVTGEMSNTADEPSRSLYTNVLAETDCVESVLDASIFIGYSWADEPRTGASVIVTGYEQGVADREAVRIAQKVWDRRAEFKFGVESGPMDEIIRKAFAESRKRTSNQLDRPVIISDSGDNPTAGGVGDTPSMIGKMIELEASDAVLQGPVDEAAVTKCCDAGVGSVVELSIGGKLDYVNAKPLEIRAEVVHTNVAPINYEVDKNAGTGNPPDIAPAVMPRAAVVRVKTGLVGSTGGAILLTLTSSRKPFHWEKDFQVLGLEPTKYPVLVVKIGYLVPDLERLCSLNLMALSPGAVYADIPTMPYIHIKRPMYPLDKGMAWSPTVSKAVS